MAGFRIFNVLSVLSLCLLFAVSSVGAEDTAPDTEIKKLEVKSEAAEPKIVEKEKPENKEPAKSPEKDEAVKNDEPSASADDAEKEKPAEENADEKQDTKPEAENSPKTADDEKDEVKKDGKPEDKKEEDKKSALTKPRILNNDYVLTGKYPASVKPWLAEIGLNNPDFNGLLYNFWNNSKASTLASLMDRFEPTSSSPVIRSMMIEALTSVTRAPKYTSANPMQEDIDFMKSRMRALIRLGAYDEAAILYQKIIEIRPGKTPIPEEIALSGIDAMALTGATDAACLEANLVSQSLPTVRRLEDKALCLLHWQQNEAADELYQFLDEKTVHFKNREDFVRIYSSLLNKTYNENTVSSKLPPLWNSILLSRGIPVNESRVYKTKDSIFLGMLARHTAIPETTRALATSLAAERGMMSIDKIRTTYMTTRYDDATVDAVAASDGSNTKRQDILYNVARNSYSPHKKLAIMKRGLSLIKDKTSISAYLWADLERELSYNAAKLVGHATEARSRLLAQSMTNYADTWVKNITEDKKNPQPYKDKINILLENHFADMRLDTKAIEEWAEAITAKHKKSGKQRVAKSLVVLEFEGISVPKDAWDSAGGKPKIIDFTFGNDILDNKNGDSYGKYDKGEIYLAGLAYFSHNGFDGIKPENLYSFMSLFKKFGLSDKNMKIGLEILSQSVL